VTSSLTVQGIYIIGDASVDVLTTHPSSIQISWAKLFSQTAEVSKKSGGGVGDDLNSQPAEVFKKSKSGGGVGDNLNSPAAEVFKKSNSGGGVNDDLYSLSSEILKNSNGGGGGGVGSDLNCVHACNVTNCSAGGGSGDDNNNRVSCCYGSDQEVVDGLRYYSVAIVGKDYVSTV